eukprot:TRINITY_DN16996_c0_g1_i2.p1 TRINITY_DN16996_c0_g1~~TRINITY_DN16996_c0_g1_i2.p1  ORF type:complete len:191 (+),score=36.74 TRINITY_DN16996_c0_g1_i2:45-617(+)
MKAARRRLVQALQAEYQDNATRSSAKQVSELESSGWTITQSKAVTAFEKKHIHVSTKTSPESEFPPGLVDSNEIRIRKFKIKIQPPDKEKVLLITVIVPSSPQPEEVSESFVVEDVLVVPLDQINNKDYSPFKEWKHPFSEKLIFSEMERLGLSSQFLAAAELVAADYEEASYRQWLSGCHKVLSGASAA